MTDFHESHCPFCVLVITAVAGGTGRGQETGKPQKFGDYLVTLNNRPYSINLAV